jgi:hypothetical protein
LFFPPLSPLLDVRSVLLNTSHTLKVIAHLCRFRYRLLLDPCVPCAFFRKPALFSSSECHHRCRSWGYFQLDGGTAVKQRQNLVDQFNNPFASECTVTSFATISCVRLDLVGMLVLNLLHLLLCVCSHLPTFEQGRRGGPQPDRSEPAHPL